MRSIAVSANVRYCLAVLAAVAAIYSFVLGMAASMFRRDTGAAVAAAAHLIPDNSDYLTRFAAWDTSHRTGLLLRAVHANPFNEQAWFRLGFDAEFQQRDLRAAEYDFRQAAHFDHMFLPRWTLANFYFRHGQKKQFLEWAKAALDYTPYPADPIFTEMWLMDPSGDDVGPYIPNRPSVLEQYLIFLSTSGQNNAVPSVVQRLVQVVGPANAAGYGLNDVIGPIEDRLIGEGYLDAALRIWSSLHQSKWIPFPTPSADEPLTNGKFEMPLWGHGFDWHIAAGDGVSTTQNVGLSEMRIQFSGNEDERFTLLQQWIVVGPGRSYQLRWKASPENLTKPSGVNWYAHSAFGDQQSPDVGESGSWNFEAPVSAKTMFLTLEYARPAGETRAIGTLHLRDVAIASR